MLPLQHPVQTYYVDTIIIYRHVYTIVSGIMRKTLSTHDRHVLSYNDPADYLATYHRVRMGTYFISHHIL